MIRGMRCRRSALGESIFDTTTSDILLTCESRYQTTRLLGQGENTSFQIGLNVR